MSLLASHIYLSAGPSSWGTTTLECPCFMVPTSTALDHAMKSFNHARDDHYDLDTSLSCRYFQIHQIIKRCSEAVFRLPLPSKHLGIPNQAKPHYNQSRGQLYYRSQGKMHTLDQNLLKVKQQTPKQQSQKGEILK